MDSIDGFATVHCGFNWLADGCYHPSRRTGSTAAQLKPGQSWRASMLQEDANQQRCGLMATAGGQGMRVSGLADQSIH